MRWSIGKRVFVALTACSLIIVGLNAVATRWSFQRGFVDYLAAQELDRLQDVAERLTALYGQEQSFNTLRENRRLWDEAFRNQSGTAWRDRQQPELRKDRGPPRPHGPRRGRQGDLFDLQPRVTLLDAAGDTVIGRVRPEQRVRRMDLSHDGVYIGALIVAARPQLTDRIDLAFSKEQTRSTIVIALIVLLLAGLLSALLTRQLTRPIVSLTRGTRALTEGRFSERITVLRDDELGDLAADFNQLAHTLQENRRLRRQWVSDISHELRTPLAILDGELQAVEDGVRTFDQGTRASLQAEVKRLSQLVNDLHELTISDEGGLNCRRDLIDVGKLIDSCMESYGPQFAAANMALQWQKPDQALTICGDERRLTQLFGNLTENAIRYTDAPGKLSVTVTEADDLIRIAFSDSPPGVSGEQLGKLFDRLYRVDASRNRATGGSGLGLAICKSIVDAHKGNIRAEHSDLGGITVVVTLPCDAAEDDKA